MLKTKHKFIPFVHSIARRVFERSFKLIESALVLQNAHISDYWILVGQVTISERYVLI